MSARRAFITGITGQTGSYLAEWLLDKDYEVFGLIRRTSSRTLANIAHLENRLHLVPGDVTDQGSLIRALRDCAPHEIYHLAAQSHVGHSFSTPVHTMETTGMGTLRMLEALRLICPTAKFYQASSSEQFGNATLSPQDESTPFTPVSPYGIAKTFAHHAACMYRRAYGLFICCGIAFNHESPRRGEAFVTRKITLAGARIKVGQQQLLQLGNTASRRDWCHAKDIVRGAWLMLQQEQPDDYVLASGVTYSVQEFVERVFNLLELSLDHQVKSDKSLFRPTEISQLLGYTAKAYRQLGWKPLIAFQDLVKEMVEADYALVTGHSLSSLGS